MNDLANALHDLADTVPDDPARLACVHRRAARAHRRRRAVGAGALAATMAATIAGAEALVSSEHGPATPTSAAPVPAAGPVPAAAATSLPACPGPPGAKADTAPVWPPAIGQQFTSGGVIASPPTATSITLTVVDATTITVTVNGNSKVFMSSPLPDVADQATTSDHLQAGEVVKFTATRTGETSYVLDELHAGPLNAGGTPATKGASSPTVATPPAVGGGFKAGGVVVSAAPGTVTVNVTRGNLAGIVTFTLQCSPPPIHAGDAVEVAGTRTGPTTYVARNINVQAAPASP